MAALLTLVAAAILFGGGSSLAYDGERLTERGAGVAMMLAGALAFAQAFWLAVQ
ncbi:hypothetical protein ACLNGM_09955 [Aureimonas phyllosphaerae]|uniref:hypothetical protein n=1 Tax=Aureimonas phyllosphaerae TaxID=1166078 RepID=UPI003A5B9F25